jgi:hypothetical protein
MNGPIRVGPNRRSTWIVAAIAAAVVIAVIVAVVGLWSQAGDVEITAAGWIALGLGVLVALALGIGLMALVFFSSRRGFDEPDSDRR